MTMELATQVESGLRAFEAFKTELGAKLHKLDALDETKFNKIADEVAGTIEAVQKSEARVKALEEGQKAVEAALARPGVSKDEVQEKSAIVAKHFREYLSSKSPMPQDFEGYMRMEGKAHELKDMTVNIDAQGGYLVLPTFGGVITTQMFETSPMRQLATVQPVSTAEWEVILDFNEAGAGLVGEVSSRPATATPNFGKIVIPTHEFYANAFCSQKVLDDAAVNLEAWLASKVADKIGRVENTQFISGDGSVGPKGILTYASGTNLGLSQIEQVNSGSSGAFTYDGIAALQASLKEPYQANATWLTKRSSFGAIMRLKSGIASDNTPIFNMMYDKNNGVETTILTRPLRFADDMPVAGANSLSLAYGDFRTAYVIVDRLGFNTLRDPYTSKPFVQFYTTKRTGGAVVNFEAIKLQRLAN
jgi:HK97 family phage major capsid protein